ncbi:MAG: alpha/beta hydrolase-fold protein [Planctomycetota bacterium]
MSRRLLAALVLCLSALPLAGQQPILRDGFEAELSEAWQGARGLTVAREEIAPAEGRACLRLERAEAGLALAPRVVVRRLDAAPWRGRTIRLSAAVRVPVLAERTRSWLGLEIDRAGHGRGFADSLRDWPATGAEWTRQEIVAEVARDATEFRITLAHEGDEPVWIDDVRLNDLGPADPDATWRTAISDRRFLEAPAQLVRVRSDLLSRFFGREIRLEASVVAPADWDGLEMLPVCYLVHGFGGDHWTPFRAWRDWSDKLASGEYPRLLYVFLEAGCGLGHHAFADSVNNGPRGRALVEELIPAVENSLGGLRAPTNRFLTGHSSGGWSTLWLQVAYPDTFGGVWSTAPDPVDFRDFSGIDLYDDANVYRDPQGDARPLVRLEGRTAMTFEEYVRGELRVADHGGQMASFEAVFSPRGEDGRPMPLFDRETGAIDPEVAQSWRIYDIGFRLRENWRDLEPRLRGKLHVWVGDRDTYFLDGAVRLLGADLAARGGAADVLIVPGRDHRDLRAPHEELWPRGMMARIFDEMLAAAGRPTGGEDAELEALLGDLDAAIESGAAGLKVVGDADHEGSCSDCGHDHGPGEGHHHPAPAAPTETPAPVKRDGEGN